MSCDISDALEAIIALGCDRVLTSGGEVTAMEGAYIIGDMIQQVSFAFFV